jgi:hypothetical protein
MRVEQKKPKVRETVTIPKDFAEFMTSVLASIENKEEVAVLPSDDLIQCDFACGGMVEEGGNIYEFTYFPEDIKPKWEVVLTTDEIQQIADGSKTSWELWACSDNACGCKFWDSEGSCFYCDWIGEAS